MAVEEIFVPSRHFWRDKRVLVTGHTGFVGSWLTFWLSKLGAEVYGFSLADELHPISRVAVDSAKASIRGDVRHLTTLEETLTSLNPAFIFHLAAQPLVGEGYSSPMMTVETNVMGTANILEAARKIGTDIVSLIVTSDKVYRAAPGNPAFQETDCLGGDDPYSFSKASADIIALGYASMASGVGITKVARAGNIIGGGDFSMGRLIPDAVRAWSQKVPLVLRNPSATRPWQHVLDSVRGYLALVENAKKPSVTSTAFNFGPRTLENVSTLTIAQMASAMWPGSTIGVKVPERVFHERLDLSLDASLAREQLGVANIFNTTEAVEDTINWYYRAHLGEYPEVLMNQALEHYEHKLALTSEDSTEMETP